MGREKRTEGSAADRPQQVNSNACNNYSTALSFAHSLHLARTHTLTVQQSHKMQAAKKRKRRDLQRQQRGILFGACGIGLGLNRRTRPSRNF